MNEINNSDNLDYSAPPRSFIEAIKVCFAKYAVFKGRASRSEFWWFYLVMQVSSFVLAIDMGSAETILVLAILVPYCAVIVRRFHDINRSGLVLVGLVAAIVLLSFSSNIARFGGWGDDVALFLFLGWVICGITLICLCATPGTKEKNKYNLPTDVGRETTR